MPTEFKEHLELFFGIHFSFSSDLDQILEKSKEDGIHYFTFFVLNCQNVPKHIKKTVNFV